MRFGGPYDAEKTQGWDAHQRGQPVTANPYRGPIVERPNMLSIAWRIGWRYRDAHMRALAAASRTITIIAGEDVEQGNVVRISDGKAYRA